MYIILCELKIEISNEGMFSLNIKCAPHSLTVKCAPHLDELLLNLLPILKNG